MKVLAGDIGGTKTSLAVFEVSNGQLAEQVQADYDSRSNASLDSIVRRFVADFEVRFDCAAFGVAGPVRDGRCRTTNLPWVVDARRLAGDLGVRVWLINDLEANAWGLAALNDDDLCVLNEGRPSAGGNACIIAAGTGLGEAGLYWDGQRHRPFASEGGHSDFAPSTGLEIALLRHLQQRYDHVSWERVVSGTGLLNIHEFLCRHRRQPPPDWLVGEMRSGDAAAAISRAAQQGRCPQCREALAMFIRLYGVEAGNHALKLMASGGVYLGGGIAPKLVEQLRDGGFLDAFVAKGRMEALMRDMPVKVILNERTALYGPALYAAAAEH